MVRARPCSRLALLRLRMARARSAQATASRPATSPMRSSTVTGSPVRFRSLASGGSGAGHLSGTRTSHALTHSLWRHSLMLTMSRQTLLATVPALALVLSIGPISGSRCRPRNRLGQSPAASHDRCLGRPNARYRRDRNAVHPRLRKASPSRSTTTSHTPTGPASLTRSSGPRLPSASSTGCRSTPQPGRSTRHRTECWQTGGVQPLRIIPCSRATV